MEAISCVMVLTNIDGKLGVAVYCIVGVDESSFCANIRHSWKDIILLPLYLNFIYASWPRNKFKSDPNKGKF